MEIIDASIQSEFTAAAQGNRILHLPPAQGKAPAGEHRTEAAHRGYIHYIGELERCMQHPPLSARRHSGVGGGGVRRPYGNIINQFVCPEKAEKAVTADGGGRHWYFRTDIPEI